MIEAVDEMQDSLQGFKQALLADDREGSTPCWPKRKGYAMLWEVEIESKGPDRERQRIGGDYDLLTQGQGGAASSSLGQRGYLLQGDLSPEQAPGVFGGSAARPLVEIARLAETTNVTAADEVFTVLPNPA